MTRERFPGRIRLARALRSAGSGGVHSLTIREDLKIGNPSERIEDLRRRGFEIDPTVEPRHGCHGTRYVMTADAGDSAAWLTDSELDDADLNVEVEPMCFLADYTKAGFRPQASPDEPFPRVPLAEVWSGRPAATEKVAA